MIDLLTHLEQDPGAMSQVLDRLDNADLAALAVQSKQGRSIANDAFERRSAPKWSHRRVDCETERRRAAMEYRLLAPWQPSQSWMESTRSPALRMLYAQHDRTKAPQRCDQEIFRGLIVSHNYEQAREFLEQHAVSPSNLNKALETLAYNAVTSDDLQPLLAALLAKIDGMKEAPSIIQRCLHLAGQSRNVPITVAWAAARGISGVESGSITPSDTCMLNMQKTADAACHRADTVEMERLANQGCRLNIAQLIAGYEALYDHRARLADPFVHYPRFARAMRLLIDHHHLTAPIALKTAGCELLGRALGGDAQRLAKIAHLRDCKGRSWIHLAESERWPLVQLGMPALTCDNDGYPAMSQGHALSGEDWDRALAAEAPDGHAPPGVPDPACLSPSSKEIMRAQPLGIALALARGQQALALEQLRCAGLAAAHVSGLVELAIRRQAWDFACDPTVLSEADPIACVKLLEAVPDHHLRDILIEEPVLKAALKLAFSSTVWQRIIQLHAVAPVVYRGGAYLLPCCLFHLPKPMPPSCLPDAVIERDAMHILVEVLCQQAYGEAVAASWMHKLVPHCRTKRLSLEQLWAHAPGRAAGLLKAAASDGYVTPMYYATVLLTVGPSPGMWRRARMLYDAGFRVDSEERPKLAYMLDIDPLPGPLNVRLVEWLLQMGMPVNARNLRGDTLLHLCAVDDSYAVRRLEEQLLAHGADPNLRDDCARRPQDI